MAKIVRFKESKKLAANLFGNEYITEDGKFVTLENDDAVTFARNVPEEVRVRFNDIEKAYKKRRKAEEKRKNVMEKLRNEVINSIAEEETAIKALLYAQNILAHETFVHEFEKALPRFLKDEMFEKGFTVETRPYGVSYDDNSVYICRSKQLSKYNKNVPYAYEEYDGNFMLCDDAEDDDAYKRDVKKNSKKLSVKAKVQEGLETGDKFSIWYYGVYEIPIKEKKTAEYAARLAKEFAKH